MENKNQCSTITKKIDFLCDFLKPLPPTLSWALGKYLLGELWIKAAFVFWENRIPDAALLSYCYPHPCPSTCHPVGTGQSATGAEVLTLISAKLSTEESSVLLSCALTKGDDIDVYFIKTRTGPVMLWLKFQMKIQTLLKRNSHTVFSANQAVRLFWGFPVKHRKALGIANKKTNDKGWCSWSPALKICSYCSCRCLTLTTSC